MGPKDQIKVIKKRGCLTWYTSIYIYIKKMQFVKTSYMMSTLVNVY